MIRFSTIDEVWAYLEDVPKFQMVGASAANFGLERITELSARMGNLHAQFPSIHVAGTNGKGTVCNLLAHIYKQAGYKTGLFTSPHLLRYNERVQISGEEIGDDLILKFFQEADDLLQEFQPTYFEISTLLAFWAFAREEVELAIIETGLGGRLDSTNIVRPLVSIITSIDLDHQDILGDSLEAIAREKAGIIKQNIPVVLGRMSRNAEAEIELIANHNTSTIVSVKDINPLFSNGLITVNNSEASYKTHFREPVNRWNVGMVLLTVQELQKCYPVSMEQLKISIENYPGLPARFEKIREDREWYFTGAHNPQALSAMKEWLDQHEEKKAVLIFSFMKDKVTAGSLNYLKGFETSYYYPMSGERAADYEFVSRYLKPQLLTESNKKEVFKELETSLVIFAGSFYFYPTVKQWMEIIN